MPGAHHSVAVRKRCIQLWLELAAMGAADPVAVATSLELEFCSSSSAAYLFQTCTDGLGTRLSMASWRAPSTRPDPKVSLARRWPKGSGTPVGQSRTARAQTSDTSAIHNFRVPVRSVTYPPGGGLLAVLWPQGWVYWPNNGHCSACHTKFTYLV